MDGQETAHIEKLHVSILTALLELRQEGSFGDEDTFLVVWIPDSAHPIMYRSAKTLNLPPVDDTFMSEFG